MSQARPMHHQDRLKVYHGQNGYAEFLTPRQERRLKHKLHEKMRETSRHGRLRRRFDAKDIKQVKAEARRAAELTRFLLDRARGRR